jgi:PIN domain nuclease of toxin-antitoxin system
VRYLLDTHTLLWSLFRNPDNELSVSVISFWEISLKYALKKIDLIHVKPEHLPQTTEQMGVHVIPLASEEAASFYQLPRLAHKDPFDRLIIWQAIQQKMILISADPEFKLYRKHGLNVRW